MGRRDPAWRSLQAFGGRVAPRAGGGSRGGRPCLARAVRYLSASQREGQAVPNRPKPRMPDLVGAIGLVLIVAVLAGAYYGFPWLMRVMSYQDCIASGRITGC